MDFEPTDDQAALQAELRRFLGDRVTPEARRAAARRPGAVDPRLWRELGGMGVFSLTLPEAEGGAGLGLAEATLVFEELGRAVVPGPVIGTFLAAACLRSADPGDAGAADDAAAPTVVASLATGAATGGAVVGVLPRPAAGGAAFVEHLGALDALLVVGDDGVSVVEPPLPSRPVERPLDPLTPVDVVDGLPDGVRVGGPDVAARLRRSAGLLAAGLQVGLADAAVSMGTAYALQRTQFGRVIGSFQALKHLLADAQVQVEVARAAVQAAGVQLDDADLPEGGDAARAARAVDAARIVAARAANCATRACVQVHGGMGFTWEHDAHLLLKRALVLDAGLGTPEAAVESLAAAL
jgi:alkylation response protein AidB-like acyl-CoA dehydrogenase